MNVILGMSVTILATALSSATASGQTFGAPPGADRTGTWEAYGGLRTVSGESLGFAGGSTIKTDNDWALGFGFGYNFSEHLLVGGDVSFGTVDYDGVLVSADDPDVTQRISGEVDTFGFAANATWHFIEGPLTPFVSASLGFTSVDTNIAEGPPQIGCWWDPWYGQICNVYVDTKTEDSFTYGLGLGGRWDFAPGWFARISYEERWLDIGKATGTPSFGGLRLDIGSKF
jgi:opacity protein-like surface antigen